MDLPFNWIMGRGRVLCESIVPFSEMQCKPTLQIRTLDDVSEQLRRGVLLDVDGKELWFYQRYECLLDFFFLYGHVDHPEKDCT